MAMKDAKPEEISHSTTGSRGVFFLQRDGRRVGELTYTFAAGAALVESTYVEPPWRGGTIAPSLVEAAVRWARKENVKIVPLCSYVRSVFSRKPEYGDVRK
jgi:predicted GNAT family acetyltransferase